MLFAAAALLAGCQTTGQPGASSNNEVPSDYRQQVAASLRSSLKDPYSVRDARISLPTRTFAGLIWGGTIPAVCLRYNAKNSFGAYTGIKTYFAHFQSGQLVRIADNEFACGGDIGYVQFTEIDSAPVPPPVQPARR
jgi:hypothetical protein